MILDLFAGPGGWDEGLRLLGRSDVVGLEWDAAACRTRAAAGHRTIRTDVTTYPTAPFAGRVEGLIASPPCQDFSVAGKRAGRGGARGQLIDDVPRWVTDLGPRWLAFEQVPPALEVWEEFARVFRLAGYRAWAGILNAADFGVPQTRRRAFLLAHRDRPVAPPEPTHAKDPQPALFGTDVEPWVSMAQALGWAEGQVGFPRRDDTGTSPDGYRERDWRDTAEPAGVLTEKARSWVVRTGANTMKHSRRTEDIEPYERSIEEPAPTLDSKVGGAWVVNTGRDWKPGGSREDAQTVPLDEPAPAIDGKGRWHLVREATGQTGARSRETVRDQDEPAPPLAFGHNANAWAWEQPATTVVGDPRNWPPGHKINADDERRLGAEEAAKRYGDRAGSEAIRLTIIDALVLQSFRPDFPVQGTKTKQFEQVGNAVPPGLAAAVLRAVIGA